MKKYIILISLLVLNLSPIFAQNLYQKVGRHVQVVSHRRNVIQDNVVDIKVLVNHHNQKETYSCQGILAYPSKQVVTARGCFKSVWGPNKTYSLSVKAKTNSPVNIPSKNITFTGEFAYIDVPQEWSRNITGIELTIAPGAGGIQNILNNNFEHTFLSVGYDLVNVKEVVGNDKFKVTKLNKAILAGTPIIHLGKVVGFATYSTQYNYYIKEDPLFVTPNTVNGGKR